MIIAQQKKAENIIEYLLYMWQVEDLARANKLDMHLIKDNIISQYQQPQEVMEAITQWWENLVAMMVQEKKEQEGHLQVNINTLNDVNRLHMKLLNDPQEVTYKHQYHAVAGHIRSFDEKSKQQLSNDIEVCLTAIYSTFILKLKGQSISAPTQEAVKSMSQFLAKLAARYKDEFEE